MPLIGSLELTIEDCVIREHNEYLKLLQPRNDDGVPLQPPQLLQTIEKSMLIVGDGVCVCREGQRKHSTRAAYENLDKISKKVQDARQQHKGRLPRPNMIIEVKTFDQVEEVNQAFSCAPLGLAFLRLYARADEDESRNECRSGPDRTSNWFTKYEEVCGGQKDSQIRHCEEVCLGIRNWLDA